MKPRAAWKKLTRLSSPTLCMKDLLTQCTCQERSGHPGPHHDKNCPVYATHKIDIFRCDGVWKDRINLGRHSKQVITGPIKLTLVEIDQAEMAA